MENELTEAQLKKVEISKSKDNSIGEAIELPFDMQDQTLAISEKNTEENILEK